MSATKYDTNELHRRGWALIVGGVMVSHRDFGEHTPETAAVIERALDKAREELREGLTKLRKPEAPTDWNTGQVWQQPNGQSFVTYWLGGMWAGIPVVGDGRLRFPHRGMVVLAGFPADDLTYLGTYTELFGRGAGNE